MTTPISSCDCGPDRARKAFMGESTTDRLDIQVGPYPTPEDLEAIVAEGLPLPSAGDTTDQEMRRLFDRQDAQEVYWARQLPGILGDLAEDTRKLPRLQLGACLCSQEAFLRGKACPRAGWLCHKVRQMKRFSMFSHAFFDEIIALARQISWNLREQRRHLWADPDDPEILPVESVGKVKGLRVKFSAELDELHAASEPWDELPDLAYYAACLQARRGDDPMLAKFALTVLFNECRDRGVSWQELEAATLAKYRRRAAGMPKDILAERAAIKEALRAVGWHEPEDVRISLVTRASSEARAALAIVEEEAQLSWVILFGGDRWSCVEVVAVAHTDNDILGMATLAPTDELGKGGPQIIGVWVRVTARKRGIGCDLVKALVAESQRRYRQTPTIVPVTAAGLALAEAAIRVHIELAVQPVTRFGALLP